jgi:PAS domain S-box-containing protein
LGRSLHADTLPHETTSGGRACTIVGSDAHDESLEDDGDPGSRYRTLLEQIPAIVYVWEVAEFPEGMKEKYVSPQVEDVLGFRSEEWMADPTLWIERLHPDDRSEVMDETARSVEAGEPFKLEYRMIARDGRVVWLHDVASVVARDDRGKAARYQGVQLDITARKEAEHAQRRALQQLRVVDEERRHLVRRLVGAQEAERRRISEGLHDDAMQRLFAMQNRLGQVAHERPDLQDVEAFTDLAADVSEIIQSLRRLAFDLHPRILDEHGLRASLRSLVERSGSSRADTRFVLDYRLTEDPSEETSLAIYLIAREALSNACRHSDASDVTVRLEDHAGGVSMVVEDDGRGFGDLPVASAEHLGLVSMRERAEILDGRLQVDSAPARGTRVHLWLPRGLASSATPPGRSSVPREPNRKDPGGPEDVASSLDRLSMREQEVAELLALGHTNAEIGSILHLSVRTVEHHRSRVFRKLGVRSRAAVVRALAERRDVAPGT